MHPDTDRVVAIKVFRLDLPPERVHQLVAELEKLIGANLAHPGIAAPIAAGISGVSAYVAQEFAEAESLDVVVRDYGPAPPPDAIRIVTELAGALDFAAVVNVTHGMLHPRDVLIAAEEVRLTGMGIGPALERIGVAAPMRRPYTAPERLAGGRWDRRADVFSLAAVMFELLFGRRIAGTGEQAREAVTEIAGANVRQLRAVFARALAEDPAERFDTALEFAEQLKGAFSEAALTFVPGAEPVAAAADVGPSEPTPLTADENVEPPITHAVATGTPERPAADDLDLRAVQAVHDEQEESGPIVPAEITSPPRGGVGLSRPGTDVASGFSRTDSAADATPVYAPPPQKRSLFVPIAAALLLGGVIGALASGVFRTRQVPTVVQMTGAPSPVAAPALAPRAELVPTEPAVVPVPSTVPPPSEHRDTNGPAASIAPAPRPAPSAAPRTAPADDSGRLLVRSTPAGAYVFVDGRHVGPTPQTVRDLAPGTHMIRVVQDGYTPEERRVVISATRPAQSITVELARPHVAVDRVASTPAPSTPGTVGRFLGVLLVDSRPPGARVFVDGKAAGTTPLEMSSIDAGSHALRLEMDGYQRWTSAIRVVAGERNRVTASLER